MITNFEADSGLSVVVALAHEVVVQELPGSEAVDDEFGATDAKFWIDPDPTVVGAEASTRTVAPSEFAEAIALVSVALIVRMPPEVDVETLDTFVPLVTVTELTPEGSFSLIETLVPEATPPSLPMVNVYDRDDPTLALEVPDFAKIKLAAYGVI